MPNDNDGRSAPRDVSRRHLFKQVGLAGAAAAVTATAPGVITAAAQPAPAAEPATTAAAPRPPAAIPTTPLAAPRLEALETLTAAEADTLEAIVARLIPTDENGPGATEARAAHYIDRALAGPLRTLARQLCRRPRRARRLRAGEEGRAVRQARRRPIRIRVLTDMEKNAATGFTPNAAAFFTLVRTHTIQGTFCDPYYGGNANFVGWDLIGYPGIRTGGHRRRAAHEDARQARTHKSAYDDAGFAMNGATQGRRPWPSTLRRPTSSSSGSARPAASPRCRSRRRASR